MKFILFVSALSAASAAVATTPKQSCKATSDCQSGMMCLPHHPKNHYWQKKGAHGAYPMGVPGQSHKGAYGHQGGHPKFDPAKIAAMCAAPDSNCVCKKPRERKTQGYGGAYPTPTVTATASAIATQTVAPVTSTPSKTPTSSGNNTNSLVGSSALGLENILAFVASGASILFLI